MSRKSNFYFLTSDVHGVFVNVVINGISYILYILYIYYISMIYIILRCTVFRVSHHSATIARTLVIVNMLDWSRRTSLYSEHAYSLQKYLNIHAHGNFSHTAGWNCSTMHGLAFNQLNNFNYIQGGSTQQLDYNYIQGGWVVIQVRPLLATTKSTYILHPTPPVPPAACEKNIFCFFRSLSQQKTTL